MFDVVVNVDEWLNSANAEMLAAPDEEDNSQKSSSSISIKTDSSGAGQRVRSTYKPGLHIHSHFQSAL